MTDNPFLKREQRKDDKQRHPSYWRSKKQEKETSKKLNMRPTPASGSQRQKGDMYEPSIARVECKTTANSSYRLTKEDLLKIINASLPNGQVPAMVIEFNNTGDSAMKNLEVAVIRVSDLQHYLELLRNEHRG